METIGLALVVGIPAPLLVEFFRNILRLRKSLQPLEALSEDASNLLDLAYEYANSSDQKRESLDSKREGLWDRLNDATDPCDRWDGRMG